MRHERTNSRAPGQPASKRCSACRAVKPTDDFYADRHGRRTSRCKDCHRRETRASNRRRAIALRLLIAAHLAEYHALLRDGRVATADQPEQAPGGGPDAA
jgi:NAD-dependent SIR2 family protein deacetylase